MAPQDVDNPKVTAFPASKIAPLLRVLAEDEGATADDVRRAAADRVERNLTSGDEARSD